MFDVLSARILNWFLLSSKRCNLLAIVGVQLLATGLLFVELERRELWASHEARAAQLAQGFLDTQHFGLLRLFDGSPDYQKPPFFYWFVAGTAWVRGSQIDEFAVRLPAALSGWLTVGGIMAYLFNQNRLRAAWIAGLVLITTHHFLSISRTGRVDLPLTCAVTWAILLSLHSRPLLSGLCLGVAILLKGPIALAITLVTLAALRTNWRRLARITALGVIVGAPWFIVAGIETGGEYWREFFLHHNFQRATGSAADLAAHPIWFYPVRALVDGLPWSLILLITLITHFRHWRVDREFRTGLIWVLAVIGLLSLSRFKRADYLLPAYPAAAICAGCLLEQTTLRRSWILVVVATLLGNMAYQFVYLPTHVVNDATRQAVATIRGHVTPGEPLILFRVEDHLLSWKLGRPIATVREWENLDQWISNSATLHVLMPRAEVGRWPQHLRNGTLQEIEYLYGHAAVKPGRTWVLMKSQHHGKTD